MSDGWMDGIPRFPCPDPGSAIVPLAGVVHDTIGSWPGDRDYITRNSLAHFTVGPEEGNWAQHASVFKFLPHCNGANSRAFGVEFSAQAAGQSLTAWQKKAWSLIRAWAVGLGIPDTYQDPDVTPDASIHVNDGSFAGWISHISVRTDDGTAQHTDYVQAVDFNPVVPPTPPTPILLEDIVYSVVSGTTPNSPLFQVWFNPVTGQQVKQVLGQGTAPLVVDALTIGTARAKTFDGVSFTPFVIDQGHMDNIATFGP